jgi:hypothetical protein
MAMDAAAVTALVTTVMGGIPRAPANFQISESLKKFDAKDSNYNARAFWDDAVDNYVLAERLPRIVLGAGPHPGYDQAAVDAWDIGFSGYFASNLKDGAKDWWLNDVKNVPLIRDHSIALQQAFEGKFIDTHHQALAQTACEGYKRPVGLPIKQYEVKVKRLVTLWRPVAPAAVIEFLTQTRFIEGLTPPSLYAQVKKFSMLERDDPLGPPPGHPRRVPNLREIVLKAEKEDIDVSIDTSLNSEAMKRTISEVGEAIKKSITEKKVSYGPRDPSPYPRTSRNNSREKETEGNLRKGNYRNDRGRENHRRDEKDRSQSREPLNEDRGRSGSRDRQERYRSNSANRDYNSRSNSPYSNHQRENRRNYYENFQKSNNSNYERNRNGSQNNNNSHDNSSGNNYPSKKFNGNQQKIFNRRNFRNQKEPDNSRRNFNGKNSNPKNDYDDNGSSGQDCGNSNSNSNPNRRGNGKNQRGKGENTEESRSGMNELKEIQASGNHAQTFVSEDHAERLIEKIVQDSIMWTSTLTLDKNYKSLQVPL